MTEAKSNVEKLRVDLGERSYDIVIGAGVIDELAAYMPFDMSARKAFILTDENVSAAHGARLEAAIKALDVDSVYTLVLPAGEATKSYEQLLKTLDWMLDNGVNRQSVLFALGGGVIGDLGGFAASIILRGIPYVQIPTSLLAQVDSAVGGKTAIDVPQGKNLVGAFYQPVLVLSDTDTLNTLPAREIQAGYAEVVKYGLIRDKGFFEWLDRLNWDIADLSDPEAIRKAIKTSCVAKAQIVEEDEQEGGVRALLNLGHTFGHALEVCAGYDGRLLHGEAVSVGMCLAFALSEKMGLSMAEETQIVKKHLKATGLPVHISDIDVGFDIEAVLAAMQSDKKMTKSGLNFVLVKGIGAAFVSKDVNMADVKDVIQDSMNG